MGGGTPSNPGSKVTQRDVFLAVVSIVVAAIGAGWFLNSCSAEGDGTPGGLPSPSASAPDGEAPREDAALDGEGRDDPEADEGRERAASEPDVRYLSELKPAHGTARTGAVHLVGTDYEYSVRVEHLCLGEQVIAYALEGAWDTFEATLGVTLEAHPGDIHHFRVHVDNEPATDRIALTKYDTERVTVDVSGAAELRSHVNADIRCGTGGQPVWGDAVLGGVP
ncbi:NPCBM/NEW2 domain-containing protein [Streptomyces sp. ST2-7A]|uniref:NPCBM/NEW2 domain-containing protein n=1 Tax=Streptomyces sp. ST2-7A TaxID=2907214 RepID=UPI001F28BADF|nr:NPCBM/NEW2 domain-containing protein [Streptomyces sp. ST2-7A]MCE7083029.1 NPCBM/NEW2 domain-containing protein [Streptomyces sp. ST2-7A]